MAAAIVKHAARLQCAGCWGVCGLVDWRSPPHGACCRAGLCCPQHTWKGCVVVFEKLPCALLLCYTGCVLRFEPASCWGAMRVLQTYCMIGSCCFGCVLFAVCGVHMPLVWRQSLAQTCPAPCRSAPGRVHACGMNHAWCRITEGSRITPTGAIPRAVSAKALPALAALCRARAPVQAGAPSADGVHACMHG